MKKKRDESTRRNRRRFEQSGRPSVGIPSSESTEPDHPNRAPRSERDPAIEAPEAVAEIDTEIADTEEELFGEGADRRRFLIRRDVRKRVDVYLLDRLKGISRNRIQKLIDLGGVKVNERLPKASTLILKGDVIDVILPAPAIRSIDPEPIPLHILYEDAHFIVVNKQAGLIVHPARSHLAGTLLNGLAHHFKQQREASGQAFKVYRISGFKKGRNGKDPSKPPAASPSPLPASQALSSAPPGSKEYEGPPVTVEGLSEVGAAECRPGIIHRLDRYTTGVMVVAKGDEAHWGIARQFEDRKTMKAYLALVHGNFEVPAIVIDEPIGKHPTVREAFSIRRDSQGKESVTICRVREQYKGYSLIELELKTGRTHQIRVHMNYLGHPIAGDIIYGGEPIGEAEIALPPVAAGSRQFQAFARSREEGQRMEARAAARSDMILFTPALHAGMLSFVHPITQEVVRFTAPLHQPMLDLVRRLRQHPVAGPVATEGTLIDLNAAVPT